MYLRRVCLIVGNPVWHLANCNQMSQNSQLHSNTYHIFLMWQIFFQGRTLLIDLIGRSTKIWQRWALNMKQSEAATVSLFFSPTMSPPPPYPRVFCTLPSFARIKRPRWRPVKLNNRHLQSHRLKRTKILVYLQCTVDIYRSEWCQELSNFSLRSYRWYLL